MHISEITIEFDKADLATIEGDLVRKVIDLNRSIREEFEEVTRVSHGTGSYSNCTSHPDFVRKHTLHLSEAVEPSRLAQMEAFVRAHLLTLQPA